MLRHLLKIVVLGSTAFSCSSCSQEGELEVIDGALFGSSLVVLFDDGSLTAWSMPSGEVNTGLSIALQNRRLLRIATSGEELWGATGEMILQWNSNDQRWDELAPQYGDALEALVATDEDLMQVYARAVIGTTSGRQHSVPKFGGQLGIDYLSILALHPQGEILWIGTGQGEWGGHLIALNTRTGEWNSYYDPLHYVTGITRSTNDDVLVSWSMSHFLANTLIREHAADAEPVQEFDELEDRYYQSISASPVEGKLYGVEQNALVEIESGAPTELASLGRLGYSAEPNAIGVRPAIVALIPVDASTVAILHEKSLPMLFRGNRLQKLGR